MKNSIDWSLALIIGVSCSVLLASACVTEKAASMAKEERNQPVRSVWPPSEYAAMAERGQQLFKTHCARCHTVNGVANVPGPDLSDYGSEGWSHVRTADTIHDVQRYYPGTKMPQFGEKVAKEEDALTDRQIDELAAYVMSLRKRADYLPENQNSQEAK